MNKHFKEEVNVFFGVPGATSFIRKYEKKAVKKKPYFFRACLKRGRNNAMKQKRKYLYVPYFNYFIYLPYLPSKCSLELIFRSVL